MPTSKSVLLTLAVISLPALAGAQARPAFSDLAAHTAEQPAINSMVAQGIMRGVSQTQFSPDAANTRGDFALSVQHMFNLQKPERAVTFADVPTSSQIYAAVQAVAPYLGRQMLCFGCALGDTFGPNEPVTRAQTTVTLTGILLSQQRLSLLSAAAAESALANVADAKGLSAPARQYVATGLQGGVITLTSVNQLNPAAQRTRADTAALLDSIQKKFNVPQVRP